MNRLELKPFDNHYQNAIQREFWIFLRDTFNLACVLFLEIHANVERIMIQDYDHGGRLLPTIFLKDDTLPVDDYKVLNDDMQLVLGTIARSDLQVLFGEFSEIEVDREQQTAWRTGSINCNGSSQPYTYTSYAEDPSRVLALLEGKLCGIPTVRTLLHRLEQVCACPTKKAKSSK